MSTASVALGELVEPVETWSPEHDAPDETFTYIDLSSVDQDQKVIIGARKMPCEEAPSRARQLVKAGDVLVSTVRPNLNAVAYVPADLDGATASTGFCVLRPHPDKLHGRYLFHWVRTPRFIGEMVRGATGASYPAVSDRIVCKSRLPAPALSEQWRIAEILDKADALRTKRRTALAQLDTLTQCIFLDMFGEPVSNPKRWPVRTVKDVAEIIVPTRDKPKSFSGNVPWVTLPDLDGLFITRAQNMLTDDEATDVGNRLIPAGSVLLSCAATVGRAAIAARPVYANQQFYGLVPRQEIMTAEYLCLYFSARGERFFKQLGGSFTIAFFSKQKALDIPLPVPPLLLQRQLSERVMATEKLKAATRASLVELNILFGSIQHLAFRGEL
jgi:type I restriction enzyme, S subunit